MALVWALACLPTPSPIVLERCFPKPGSASRSSREHEKKKSQFPSHTTDWLNESSWGVEPGQLFYKVLLGTCMSYSRELWGHFLSNRFTFTHSPSLHKVIDQCVLWANTNGQQINSCLWLWFAVEMTSFWIVSFFPFWFWAPLGWLAKS